MQTYVCLSVQRSGYMASYKDKKTGKWYCQFYYTDWQGQRKHTSKRGFSRKKDADAWEAKHKYDVQQQKITMEYLLKRYTDHIKSKVKLGTLKITTMTNYMHSINNYILPYFKRLNVEEVTTDTINHWLVKLQEKDLERKQLTSSYINLLKSHLRIIFNYAVKEFSLSKNPVINAENIKNNVHNQRVKLWTMNEYYLFYSTIKQEDTKLICNLMFWGGLRIGEVLALKPSSFCNNKVKITETKVHVNKRYLYQSPKTKSSIREVAIPHFVYQQAMDYIAHLPYLNNDDRLFQKSRTAIANIINERSIKLNLPRISPHILRHSYASMLLNLTKDPTVVAKQIGHSNPGTTLSIYSHMIPGEEKKAAEMLDRLVTQNEIIDIKSENSND